MPRTCGNFSLTPDDRSRLDIRVTSVRVNIRVMSVPGFQDSAILAQIDYICSVVIKVWYCHSTINHRVRLTVFRKAKFISGWGSRRRLNLVFSFMNLIYVLNMNSWFSIKYIYEWMKVCRFCWNWSVSSSFITIFQMRLETTFLSKLNRKCKTRVRYH